MTVNDEQLVYVVTGASRGIGLEYVSQVRTFIAAENLEVQYFLSKPLWNLDCVVDIHCFRKAAICKAAI